MKKFQIQIFLLLATISSAPALFCAHEAGQLPRLAYTQFGDNPVAVSSDRALYKISDSDSDDIPFLETLPFDSDLESFDKFSIPLPPLEKPTALPKEQEVYFFELVPYDEKNWSSKEQEYSLVSSLLQPKKPAKPTARSEKKESKLAASSQETPLMSPRLALATAKSLFAADDNKPLSQPQRLTLQPQASIKKKKENLLLKSGQLKPFTLTFRRSISITIDPRRTKDLDEVIQLIKEKKLQGRIEALTLPLIINSNISDLERQQITERIERAKADMSRSPVTLFFNRKKVETTEQLVQYAAESDYYGVLFSNS